MSTRLALLIILMMGVALLSSCAEWTSAKTAISTHGQQTSRAALEDALWFICKATPVGTVKNRFNTPAKMKLYNGLCSNSEILGEGK